MELFNSTYINAGRQAELDWARGLAIFFMITVHVAEDLIGMPPGLFSYFLTISGGPLAAPVFMMLLGIGIVYSRNSSPQKLAKRGLSLIGLHYALNFFAFGIPLLLMFSRTSDSIYLTDFFNYMFGIDILAFAGLTFLLFALKEKLGLKTIHLVMFTLLLSCLNLILTHPVDSMYLWPFLGLFVHVNEYSFFPFFAWIAYPVIGYIAGNFLRICTNKTLLYKYLFIISSLIVVCMSLVSIKYDFNILLMYLKEPDSYYFQDFIQYILVTAIVFSWISILYFISKIKFLDFFAKILARWSQNITIMYCIQWLVIGWLFNLELTDLPVYTHIILLTGIVITILADLGAILYVKVSTLLSIRFKEKK